MVWARDCQGSYLHVALHRETGDRSFLWNFTMHNGPKCAQIVSLFFGTCIQCTMLLSLIRLFHWHLIYSTGTQWREVWSDCFSVAYIRHRYFTGLWQAVRQIINPINPVHPSSQAYLKRSYSKMWMWSWVSTGHWPTNFLCKTYLSAEKIIQ